MGFGEPKFPGDGVHGPRAQRGDETSKEYLAANPQFAAAQEEVWKKKMQQEVGIKNENTEPTPEQQQAQEERDAASQMVADHFRGTTRIPDGILTPEEAQVLSQMEVLYTQQKAANPDESVKFGLDDPSKETYMRLLHRLPLAIREHGDKQIDQVRMDEIREQLGNQATKKEPSFLTKYFNEPAEFALEELEKRRAMAMKAHGHEDDVVNLTATIEEIKNRQGKTTLQSTERLPQEVSTNTTGKKLEGEKLVDLATLSQDQYADWLVDNMIDEKNIYGQLTLKPEYRQYTEAQRVELMQKEPISKDLKDLGARLCNLWSRINASSMEGIKAIGNTGSSMGWNNFEINKGTGHGSEGKGYLTFVDPSKDFSPEVFLDFMKELQQGGFAGQVKTYETGTPFIFRFDNVVFHGKTKNDVELAMNIAKQMFGDKLSQTQYGKDGKNSEGKSKSHTDLLAEKVKKLRAEKTGA